MRRFPVELAGLGPGAAAIRTAAEAGDSAAAERGRFPGSLDLLNGGNGQVTEFRIWAAGAANSPRVSE
ncbi:MAG TPA: hypothetical protein VF223_24995 [Trebonia sp.]